MLVLAAVGSFAYNLFFTLHILSAIVAFGPGFVYPLIAREARRRGGGVDEALALGVQRITAPAVVATGLFGIVLVLLSDGAWEFSEAWISIAFLLWFAMIGVAFFAYLPALRAGGGSAGRAAMFGGVLHLLLVLMVIDMIWKPGT